MALSLAARENKSLTRLDLDKPPRDSTLPPELIVSRNGWALPHDKLVNPKLGCLTKSGIFRNDKINYGTI